MISYSNYHDTIIIVNLVKLHKKHENFHTFNRVWKFCVLRVKILRFACQTTLDLVVDGIHENKGIYIVQRTILTCGDLGCDLLNYFAYQIVRYLNVIQIFYLLRYIPLPHSAGVKCENFFFQCRLHVCCIFR